MRQGRSEKALEHSPETQNNIQERLSARQAKRAAKAAKRREKSDALKEEGNAFSRDGSFQNALARYQQAIDVHGPSAKPTLLANLAATYLKLGMYPQAEDAADKALTADPKSVEARYRRAMARKHMEMWIAADIDFRTLLTLDPGNRDARAQLAIVKEKRRDLTYLEEEEEDLHTYSDDEAPALEDDPELGESLSESSDCECTGNGIPCKFYNRMECKNGHACRFSHAPDGKSERDALGRNVCRYYLIDVCKFGERCSYLHSKEYLLQKGWWSTTEGIKKEKNRYKFMQMCNKAIADYNNLNRASGTGQTPKKKQVKGKKKHGHQSCSGSRGAEPGFVTSTSGIKKSKKKSTVYSNPSWVGYDSDRDEEDGMCGFTGSEVRELLCQGVKPWDDDAWDVLNALHDHYDVHVL